MYCLLAIVCKVFALMSY